DPVVRRALRRPHTSARRWRWSSAHRVSGARWPTPEFRARPCVRPLSTSRACGAAIYRAFGSATMERSPWTHSRAAAVSSAKRSASGSGPTSTAITSMSIAASPRSSTPPIKVADGAPQTLLHGQIVLIARGSQPIRLATIPFDNPRVYDSDTILEMARLPPSLTIIRGGQVGCEYACLFKVLGLDHVRVINTGDRLLPFADAEVAPLLHP